MSTDNLVAPPEHYPQSTSHPQQPYPQTHPQPYPQPTYPEPYPPTQQDFTVGQSAGAQPDPPQQNPVTYPTYPSQPPPPAYSNEKPPTTVQAVVQEQPYTVVVQQTTTTGRSYIKFSITTCVVTSSLSLPSLVCSIPAVICSVMSQRSFSRGDYANGVKQRKWSLGLNIAAIITFVVAVIILIIVNALKDQ